MRERADPANVTGADMRVARGRSAPVTGEMPQCLRPAEETTEARTFHRDRTDLTSEEPQSAISHITCLMHFAACHMLCFRRKRGIKHPLPHESEAAALPKGSSYSGSLKPLRWGRQSDAPETECSGPPANRRFASETFAEAKFWFVAGEAA